MIRPYKTQTYREPKRLSDFLKCFECGVFVRVLEFRNLLLTDASALTKRLL